MIVYHNFSITDGDAECQKIGNRRSIPTSQGHIDEDRSPSNWFAVKISQENNEVEDPTRVVIEVRYYIATEPFISSVIPSLLEVFASCQQFSTR